MNAHAVHYEDFDLSEWVGPYVGSPGPEGLASPLIGLAVAAVVVWRLVRPRRSTEESEE